MFNGKKVNISDSILTMDFLISVLEFDENPKEVAKYIKLIKEDLKKGGIDIKNVTLKDTIILVKDIMSKGLTGE